MAYFDVQATSTTGVELAAASSGNRARFLSIGFTNMSSTARIVTVYDGTAASGTARVRISLPGSGSEYFRVEGAGQSVFPKSWWTSGSVIEIANDGASNTRVWGEIVREA